MGAGAVSFGVTSAFGLEIQVRTSASSTGRRHGYSTAGLPAHSGCGPNGARVSRGSMLFRHDQPAAVQAAPDGGGPSGFLVERPPPGLARGKYPTSPLWIGALGTALVLATLVYYLLRLRKPRS